jgi:hypothetical protein
MVDSKVSKRIERAGFKLDPIQPIGERINTRFIHEGIIAKGCSYKNAHELELRSSYNGSGESAFGGAKEWPTLTLKVAFQVGEEDLRARLAVELAKTVHQLMKKVRPATRKRNIRH